MAKQSGRLITTWPMPTVSERAVDAQRVERAEQAQADDDVGHGERRHQAELQPAGVTRPAARQSVGGEESDRDRRE